MKPVDVLCGVDRRDHLAGIDLRRQRQLDENAVHSRVAIERVDEREQRLPAGRCAEPVIDRAHAALRHHLLLGADIDLARRIVADQHHRETGHQAMLRAEVAHGLGDPRAQRRGKRLAVDQRRGHGARVRDAGERRVERGAVAVDVKPLEARRRAGDETHRARRDAGGTGEKAHQRLVRLALGRGRPHPRLEHAAPVGEALDAFDQITTAARREAHADDKAVGTRRPRPLRRRH